jgi:hypothetical protein
MEKKSGVSKFQQEVEKIMLLAYAKEYHLIFDKNPPVLEGCSVQVDGYSKDRKVICEAYAHVGKLKSGHIRKIAQDALKLIYLDKKLGENHKKIILFADVDVQKVFKSPHLNSRGNRKWIADCFDKFEIDVEVPKLSPEIKQELLTRQKIQKR